MVDVSAKPETERIAVAGATISMKPATLRLILEGGVKKGDVLGVARLAGIMGAKRTSDASACLIWEEATTTPTSEWLFL